MKTPLYSKISAYKNVRFHMPGHSGKELFAFKENALDITEIEGMDNLLAASGVIKEAEDLIAKAYGCKHSIMVTAGSTICMQMSAYAIKQMGIEAIAIGDMHSSFYNSMRLFDIPYIQVENVQKCLDVLQKNQKQVAIFVTSPDYFGKVCNLDELNSKKGTNLLIVDAAHGAHFAFSSVLPKYPQGDIVFSSMHKTMPVHTGGAIININDDYLYELMLLNLTRMHSTSPSYITLASMDMARAYMEENGEKEYSKIKSIVESYNGRFAGFDIIKTDDISRLVLQKKGIDCYKVLKDLSKLGFEAEMAYEDKIVFILTPFNVDSLATLEKALKSVDLELLKGNSVAVSAKAKENIAGLVPAFVELDDACGYVANADLCIYPPSTPIVRYGEKIGKEDINILKGHLGHILGLVNNKVPVLK